MERLTQQKFNMCDSCSEGTICEHYCNPSFPVCGNKAIYDRLAAYEDTGLEPEDVAKMAKEWTSYETILSYVDEIGGVDHLRDLIQAERENPKPLTLDELREMDGEPVWLVDGNGNEMWGLIDMNYGDVDAIDRQFGLWNGAFYNMTGDGKRGLHLMGWLAYRHKPKEGNI